MLNAMSFRYKTDLIFKMCVVEFMLLHGIFVYIVHCHSDQPFSQNLEIVHEKGISPLTF